jgi:hypothetical protein
LCDTCPQVVRDRRLDASSGQQPLLEISTYNATASALIVGGDRSTENDLQTSRHIVDWLYQKDIQNE